MLGYVWSFSAAGLARLAQGCPKLETIDLADDYDHTSLTGDGPHPHGIMPGLGRPQTRPGVAPR